MLMNRRFWLSVKKGGISQMKKILALLTAFALVTTAAFADISGVAITGNATLEYGFDFENETNGFKNDAEFTISIPLITKKDFTHKSEGDAYAEITLEDLGFTFVQNEDFFGKTGAGEPIYDTDDSYFNEDLAVKAKLVFGKYYMTVAGKPNFESENATLFAPLNVEDWENWEDTLEFNPGDEGFGTKIGTTNFFGFDFGVKVASKYTYEGENDAGTVVVGATSAQENNVYAGKLAKKFDVNGTFNYFMDDWEALDADAYMSFGGKLSFKPSETFNVYAGFDGRTNMVDPTDPTDTTMGLDAIVGMDSKFLTFGTYYANAAATTEFVTAATDWYWVNAMKDNDPTKNIGNLAAYATVKDGGLVKNLSVAATVMAPFLLTDWEGQFGDGAVQPLFFDTKVSYMIKKGDVHFFKPFWNMKADNMDYYVDGTDTKTRFEFAHEAGVQYGLFSNAVVTLKYAVGSVYDDPAVDETGFTSDGVDLRNYIDTRAFADDKGTVTLGVTVTY
jgi:hypothetical protein